MCEREKVLSEKLTNLAEEEAAGNGSLMVGDPDGTLCGGIYQCSDGSEKRCNAKRQQRNTDVPRRTTLFTLNHGAVSIVILDWDCFRCGYRNLYRGTEHGIFPARY